MYMYINKINFSDLEPSLDRSWEFSLKAEDDETFSEVLFFLEKKLCKVACLLCLFILNHSIPKQTFHAKYLHSMPNEDQVKDKSWSLHWKMFVWYVFVRSVGEGSAVRFS